MYRARNLFIYEVAEDAINQAHDLPYVTEVLSRIPGIDLSGISIRRILSKRPNEPRPLVVRLSSHDEVIHILRNRRLLPQGFSARADWTEAERAELRALNHEIEQHNAAHPDKRKCLVYIKGVPSAVSQEQDLRL